MRIRDGDYGRGVKRWSDIAPDRLKVAPLIDADACAIMYTSGSTGPPKGVLLSHNTVVQSARAAATHIQNNSDDRLLGVLPLSFDFGLSQLTTMMLVGGTLVLTQSEHRHGITEDRYWITTSMDWQWFQQCGSHLFDSFRRKRLYWTMCVTLPTAVALYRQIFKKPGQRFSLKRATILCTA